MKPILFNTDMVRALLDGTKTVTRRVVKPQPKAKLAYCCMGHGHGKWSYPGKDAYKYWEDESFKLPEDISPDELKKIWTPPCHTGEILYLRETWAAWSRTAGTPPALYYKADRDVPDGIKWRPSIHMSREAARIFLRVTNVRVERLQEITSEQIDAEGCKEWAYSAKTGELLPSGPSRFRIAWNSTIKQADRALYGWEANPYVWVIEFERCGKPKEAVPGAAWC